MIVDRTEFRPSAARDHHALRQLHSRVFDRESEGNLAIALLEDASIATLDLLAQLDGMILGHVLLSEAADGPDNALVLGPLAVDPAWRDFQVGTQLVRRALADSRIAGWKSVFVLGEPDYYGRFGFKRSLAENVACAYNTGSAFQALELLSGSLGNYAGQLNYPAPFHAVD
ncbi:MAG: N-acetyltransferase [Pseudomonadota bacterium]